MDLDGRKTRIKRIAGDLSCFNDARKSARLKSMSIEKMEEWGWLSGCKTLLMTVHILWVQGNEIFLIRKNYLENECAKVQHHKNKFLKVTRSFTKLLYLHILFAPRKSFAFFFFLFLYIKIFHASINSLCITIALLFMFACLEKNPSGKIFGA